MTARRLHRSTATRVSTITTRPRVLKEMSEDLALIACVRFNHHDPTEGTESATASSGATAEQSRFNHHDPTEGTERDAAHDCSRAWTASFNHHDPTEGTESAHDSAASLDGWRFQPSRPDRGY